MTYLERLLDTIMVNLIVFPAFFCTEDDDLLLFNNEANAIADALEEELRMFTDSLGLPYIRPDMSRESILLLAQSHMQFVKRYIREVKRACISGVNFVFM